MTSRELLVRLRALPREVRLADRLGPTVFTSEVVDGTLRSCGEDLVIGTIRETQGIGEGTPYAEFRLRPSGEIVLVDVDPDAHAIHVNADVERFRASLAAFERWWETGASPSALRRALEDIEPGVLDRGEAYWALWVEEMETE